MPHIRVRVGRGKIMLIFDEVEKLREKVGTYPKGTYLLRADGDIRAIFKPREGVLQPKLRTGDVASNIAFFGARVTYTLPYITGRRIKNKLDQYVEGE